MQKKIWLWLALLAAMDVPRWNYYLKIQENHDFYNGLKYY